MSVPPIGWTTHATVSRVIDGDTLRVEVTRTIDVRLEDCWAPELRSEGGALSKANLEELCGGSSVVLFVPASAGDELRDIFTFGRVVGRVYCNGVDVSEAQVSAGHATRTREGSV